jgi:hypothetical protein
MGQWLVHNQSIVYRVIRPDEDPLNGLFPKNPNADKTIDYHVRCGSNKNVKTQFISTTRDINVAKKYASEFNARIVSIDLDLVDAPFYDLSTDSGRQQYLRRYLPFSSNFAKASAEVVIEGSVPPAAIQIVCP